MLAPVEIEHSALKDKLNRFCELLEAERATQWELGDLVCDAVRDHGKDVIGTFAEHARCTAEYIRQLIRVAVAFPRESGKRYPDVPWTFYRAAYQAAKRVGREPCDLLEEAVDKGWSQADLAKLGVASEDAAVGLSRTCEECGSRVSIRTRGCAGLRVNCPICGAQGKEKILGVIE